MEQEVQELKYRRQCDLNNMVSKRCRENRKRKPIEMEVEVTHLQRRNLELKRKLADLADKLQRVKE
jgi:Basic region leucine zipper